MWKLRALSTFGSVIGESLRLLQDTRICLFCILNLLDNSCSIKIVSFKLRISNCRNTLGKCLNLCLALLIQSELFACEYVIFCFLESSYYVKLEVCSFFFFFFSHLLCLSEDQPKEIKALIYLPCSPCPIFLLLLLFLK